jgi:hypothetical protein
VPPPAPPPAVWAHWRPYKTSYAAAVAAAFLDGLVLTPIGQNKSENPFVRAEAAAAHRCRGGCRRW